MSKTHPADYTTIYVRVRTASLAKVVTVAHYKTTNHKKSRNGQPGRAGECPLLHQRRYSPFQGEGLRPRLQERPDG